MRGPARYYNSKDDVANAIYVHPVETKQKLGGLLENIKIWQTETVVSAETTVDAKDSNERIITQEDDSRHTVYLKQKLIVDPNNYFAKIGMDEKEAQAIAAAESLDAVQAVDLPGEPESVNI